MTNTYNSQCCVTDSSHTAIYHMSSTTAVNDRAPCISLGGGQNGLVAILRRASCHIVSGGDICERDLSSPAYPHHSHL